MITVWPPAAPKPVDDSGETGFDSATVVDVLANDTGAALGVDAVTAPANGTATVVGGKVRYTPKAGFHGKDAFTYTVKDKAGQTATAKVAVTVRPPAAPKPVDDSGETGFDTATVVDVLANDTGAALGVDAVTAPANGTATVVDGKVRYTPKAGSHGPDTFTYTVKDKAGQTATAKVTVTVGPPAPVPVAPPAPVPPPAPAPVPVLASTGPVGVLGTFGAALAALALGAVTLVLGRRAR